MSRDSRVPEHSDTKSIAGLKSASGMDVRTMFLKLKPFGRSNNRRVVEPWPYACYATERAGESCVGQGSGPCTSIVTPGAESV